MLHTKALLLVDHQAQIVWVHVCGSSLCRSYQHITAVPSAVLKRFFSAEQAPQNAKARLPSNQTQTVVRKTSLVLLSQDGSWAKKS